MEFKFFEELNVFKYFETKNLDDLKNWIAELLNLRFGIWRAELTNDF